MAKKLMYCDECGEEFTVTTKSKETPQYCTFCGEAIDPDWNASEDSDED